MKGDPWASSWKLDVGVHTDVGRARERNEDAAKVSETPALLSVADGMGGHRGGDRASSIAVEALHEFVREAQEQGVEPGEELLYEAFATANVLILNDASRNPQFQGMGTTLTAMLFAGRGTFLAHVGDSRAWRIRDGKPEQMTDDHSLVAEQVRDGSLTEEEARVHPSRHVLSRVLGFMEDVKFDTQTVDVQAGDIYVLASDGLERGLNAEDIVRLVSAEENAQDAAHSLVQTACERDGGDNITALVVRCSELEPDTLTLELDRV
jgi:protein phosphatase